MYFSKKLTDTSTENEEEIEDEDPWLLDEEIQSKANIQVETVNETEEQQEEDEVNDNYNQEQVVTTRSGRVVRPPKMLMHEMQSTSIESDKSIEEILAVGAGIGGGFDHTSKLRPMKYKRQWHPPKRNCGEKLWTKNTKGWSTTLSSKL